MTPRIRCILGLGVLLLLGLRISTSGQSFGLAPVAHQQFFTNAGAVAAGYKLCTFAAGTTTPLAAYSDNAGTALSNPVTLNAAGRPQTAGGTETGLYLSQRAYKFILYASGTGNTCNGSAVGALIWSQDNIQYQSFTFLASTFGCNPDTGTDMTTACQTAFNSVAGGTKGLQFQPGVYNISAELAIPNVQGHVWAEGGYATWSWTGATDVTKAMWRMNNGSSLGNNAKFENFQFLAQKKAGFCIVIQNPTAANFVQFNNMNLNDGGDTNLLIGDPAGVNDISAQTVWTNSEFYNAVNYNVRLNASDLYVNKFEHSAFGSNGGNTGPITHVLIGKSGQTEFLQDDFTALPQAHSLTAPGGSVWCVWVSNSGTSSAAGGLSIRDSYFEESRVLRIDAQGRSEANVVVDNAYVNDPRTTVGGVSLENAYSIYAASSNITISNSFLAGVADAAHSDRRIFGDSPTINLHNLNIGSGGKIETTHPEFVVVDSLKPMTAYSYTKNWDFHAWQALNGVGVSDAPYGWATYQSAGGGAFNIKQATTGAYHSGYAMAINITTTGGGQIDGIQQSVPVNVTGPITFFAYGTLQYSGEVMSIGTSTGNIGGSNCNSNSVDLTWWCWTDADFSSIAPGAVAALQLGVNNNSHTAPFAAYVTAVTAFPGRFSTGLQTGLLRAMPEGSPYTGISQQTFGSAAPAASATDYRHQGEVIWNTNVSAANPIGWMNLTSNTGGTANWIGIPLISQTNSGSSITQLFVDPTNSIVGAAGAFMAGNASDVVDWQSGQGHIFGVGGITAVNNLTNASMLGLLASGGGSGSVAFVSDRSGSGTYEPFVWCMATGGITWANCVVNQQIMQAGLRGATGGGLLIGTSGTVPATGTLLANAGIATSPVTFATLPGSPITGQCIWITDSTTGTFNANITAGGGANKVQACWNGANWTAH